MRELQQREFEAWQEVAKEWGKQVGDINDTKYKYLTKLIEVWGNYLALLRIAQGTKGTDYCKERLRNLPDNTSY